MQRCIAEGVFPATTHAEVALRLLFAPIIGIAALRLSNRLHARRDADALVRDAIETTIAGIRAGAPTPRAAVGVPAECSAQCRMVNELVAWIDRRIVLLVAALTSAAALPKGESRGEEPSAAGRDDASPSRPRRSSRSRAF